MANWFWSKERHFEKQFRQVRAVNSDLKRENARLKAMLLRYELAVDGALTAFEKEDVVVGSTHPARAVPRSGQPWGYTESTSEFSQWLTSQNALLKKLSKRKDREVTREPGVTREPEGEYRRRMQNAYNQTHD